MKPWALLSSLGVMDRGEGLRRVQCQEMRRLFFFLVNKRRGRHPRPRKQYAITWEKNQANHPLEVRTSWLPGGRRAWVRRGAGG